MSEAEVCSMLEVGVVLAVIAAAILGVAWRRRPATEHQGFGSHVLVAVARPSTAVRLTQVAAALAGADRGRVTPLSVLSPRATQGDRERAEETVRLCEHRLIEEALEANGRVRVDATVADGILHGSVEYGASSVLLGWPAPHDVDRFGAPLDALVERSRVPILLARLDGYRWQRIVLRVPQEPTDDHLRASLRLATQTAERLGRRFGLEVTCVSATTPVPERPSQLVIAPLAPRAGTTRAALAAATSGSDVVFVIASGQLPERDLPTTTDGTPDRANPNVPRSMPPQTTPPHAGATS